MSLRKNEVILFCLEYLHDHLNCSYPVWSLPLCFKVLMDFLKTERKGKNKKQDEVYISWYSQPPCLSLPQKVISSFRHILLKSQFFKKLSFLPRLRACHLEVMCKARDNQVELSDSPQKMVPCLAVMLSEPVPQ